MSDETITKRLHISGLTPAISAEDLLRRLASFGTVDALDGFGKRDALGRPRPYVYATLQTTRSKLSRCLNVLSGSTWKGARLRIGEAKPDFRERCETLSSHAYPIVDCNILSIAAENAARSDVKQRSEKRLRAVQGVHAADMSPMTLERAREHPAWKVTSLGRLIRPIRMRPLHPLSTPLHISASTKQSPARSSKRKRTQEPPTRARRKLIDPLQWGSQQVKGVFLEVKVDDLEEGGQTGILRGQREEEFSENGDGSESTVSEDLSTLPRLEAMSTCLSAQVPPGSRSSRPSMTPVPRSSIDTPPSPSAVYDLVAEKNSILGLLTSLFGSYNAHADWGGSEDLSDVDMEVVSPHKERIDDTEQNFEIVPRNATAPGGEPNSSASAKDLVGEQQTSMSTLSDIEVSSGHAAAATKSLKDLFAPQQEGTYITCHMHLMHLRFSLTPINIGFSLLGHLNLDLDLDLELDEPALPLQQPPDPLSIPTSYTNPTPSVSFTSANTLPLFFASSSPHGRDGSIFAALRNIADSEDFVGNRDEGARRKHWEEVKGELTREWKRRHREAFRVSKWRGGNTS